MIQFRIRDRDHPEYSAYSAKGRNHYRVVTRKGRTFAVGDRRVELFTLGVLAEAIDRKTNTIVNWERAGKFPKPLYSVPSSKYKRWYSAEQVMNLHHLMHYRYGNAKTCQFDPQQFFTDVSRVYYESEIVVSSSGQINLK